MAHQIIKQPNGKYAVWSTMVDHFILYDATPEDIIADRIEQETARITVAVRKTIRELDEGGKPYHQFTKTFDEAMAWARAQHGDEDEGLQAICRQLDYTLPPPAFTRDDED